MQAAFSVYKALQRLSSKEFQLLTADEVFVDSDRRGVCHSVMECEGSKALIVWVSQTLIYLQRVRSHVSDRPARKALHSHKS